MPLTKVGGQSKSTLVEEGRQWLIENRIKTNKGKREGPSMCIRLLFKKKNAEIFKMKFYNYSPVFPIDYNGSMKY